MGGSRRAESSADVQKRICLARETERRFGAQISKGNEMHRSAMGLGLFRQPAVRSSGAAPDFTAPTQPTPFPAAQSLVVPASPSAIDYDDAFVANRLGHTVFQVADSTSARRFDEGQPYLFISAHQVIITGRDCK